MKRLIAWLKAPASLGETAAYLTLVTIICFAIPMLWRF